MMKSETSSGANAPTIMIVDDTPANVGVLGWYLEENGFRVVVAQDGEEALQRAQFVHPDLILLDVMMPGIDGFETCRRLKMIDGVRDIPVIFMTALADTNEKVTGFNAGGVDYVTKPCQIEEVLARVNTHVSLRSMQQRLLLQNQALQHEIQARAKAQADLRMAQLAIDHATIAIFGIAPAGEIIYVNQSACRLLKCSKKELLAMHASDLDVGASKNGWPAHWEKIRQERAVTMEVEVLARDGAVLPQDATFVHLEIDGQQRVVVYMRDTGNRAL